LGASLDCILVVLAVLAFVVERLRIVVAVLEVVVGRVVGLDDRCFRRSIDAP